MKYTISCDIYLKAITIEGICKLLLLQKVKSSVLLAYLMIPYFDNDSSSIIQQILQVFFVKFTELGQFSMNMVANAFKMALSLMCSSLANIESIEAISFSLNNINKSFNFI